MIKYTLGFLLAFFFLESSSQGYFQQEVDYKIDVKLIDSIHTLTGDIQITYKNNSPDTLSEIFMHLWGNAYKNRSTAFAQQKLRQFNTEFYFADEEEYGYYSELDFMVNGLPIAWNLTDENIDIAQLSLEKGLNPGDSLIIETPFALKIPYSFSRLGHIETSYQLTQWYPKPAVYDKDGWHPMPYLDLGEYYSEFGDYDVRLTLPANYYVGATGTLLSAAELERLEDRVAFTRDYLKDSIARYLEFPPSSSDMKTLHYRAEDVHDFAMFADKRFLVLKDTAVLESGKQVDCWVFFTDLERDLWIKGAFYVKRAVEFYSERVGEYPYPQATAVQSALSAGAGMEYPMITVIGQSVEATALDQVITHEVGHNWFYGILASNERDYPWMDEGMNSFHDHKYTSIYYGDFDELNGILPKKIEEQLEYSTLAYVYQIWARLGKDQAPNTTSNDFTMVNYFLGAYEKPAIAFKILEEYVGEERFVNAMRSYYDEWSFRHPQPKDVKQSFEKSLDLDLDWLFEGMLYSNQVYDYKITDINYTSESISVQNLGTIAAPLSISISSDTGETEQFWFPGFLGKKELKIPAINEARIAEIDQDRITLDIQPGNNDFKVKGGAVLPKPRIRFLSGVTTSKTTKLFVVPVMGYNTSNLFQLGLAFHNYAVPLSKFQYYLNPSIGTRKGEFIGSFEFRRDFPRRSGVLRNISVALGGKSYQEDYNDRFDYNLRFIKIQPSIEFLWKEKMVSPVSHFLSYRPIGIITEHAQIGRETGLEGKEQNLGIIHDLGYRYVRRSPIAPLIIRSNAEYRRYERGEQQRQYLKLYASADAKYAYKEGKFFEIRGFLGFFPFHSEKSISTSAALGNFSMFHRGFNDYKYDYHFFDRRGQEGLLSRQVTMTDGGFKNGLTNSMPLGLSNNYMASVNLAIDLPFRWTRLIPLKPYFDAGVYSFKGTSSDPFQQKVLYSGGVMLDFKRTIMIHFPIFNSDDINNIYAQTANSYWERISFTIDLNQLNPHGLKYWFYR